MSSEPLGLPSLPSGSGFPSDNGNSVLLIAADGSDQYTLIFPPTNDAGALTNDGTGAMSWVPAGSIIVNDSNVNGQFLITQAGGGNSNMVFSDPVASWSVGIDQADASKFKITQAPVHGAPFDLVTMEPGAVTIGATAPSEIRLDGGVSHQLDVYAAFPPAAPDTVVGTDLVITSTHYAVRVDSDAYSGALLPSAAANPGRRYIISRGFAGPTTFFVKTTGGDVFDGGPVVSMEIPILGGKVQVISDGQAWLFT